VPDLSRFARREEPVPSSHGDELRQGIAAHHRADAAFHDHPLFTSWMAEVRHALPSSGRGGLAAAHVAVELLIDGALLDAGAAGAYDDALAWAQPSFDGTWDEVVSRMRTGEIIEAYRRPDGVAERVVAVLRRRPRLAPLAPAPADLAAAVAGVSPSVLRGLSQLLDEVSERSLM
jgi:acyl carrier protein phosphodiesterase